MATLLVRFCSSLLAWAVDWVVVSIGRGHGCTVTGVGPEGLLTFSLREFGRPLVHLHLILERKDTHTSMTKFSVMVGRGGQHQRPEVTDWIVHYPHLCSLMQCSGRVFQNADSWLCSGIADEELKAYDWTRNLSWVMEMLELPVRETDECVKTGRRRRRRQDLEWGELGQQPQTLGLWVPGLDELCTSGAQLFWPGRVKEVVRYNPVRLPRLLS